VFSLSDSRCVTIESQLQTEKKILFQVLKANKEVVGPVTHNRQLASSYESLKKKKASSYETELAPIIHEFIKKYMSML
jgi:hypothetical protein